MASGDWIKLHRRLLENPIMQHDGICRLWVYCLMRANWKASKWMLPGTTTTIDIPRGAFITGRYELHAALYPKRGRGKHTADIPSASTVWRWLMSLQQMQCITVSNVNNRCSMVSVCKYGTYQDHGRDERTTDEQLVDNCRTTGGQLVDTEEERKESKEEKERAAQAHLNISTRTIKNHESAFTPFKFKEVFQEIAKRHPVKESLRSAEAQWRNLATDEATANEINKAHLAFCGSRRWLDEIGVPSLVNFLAKEYWKNPPDPEPGGHKKPAMTREEELEYALKCREAIDRELDPNEA